MQIGSPGAAYGPGGVMSRPTLGRSFAPVPRPPQGGPGLSPPPQVVAALQAALAGERRMPSPARTDQGGMIRALANFGGGKGKVLLGEALRRAAAMAHARSAHQSYQDAMLDRGGDVAPDQVGNVAAGLTAPQAGYGDVPYLDHTMLQAFTAHPSALLARARLNALMGGGS